MEKIINLINDIEEKACSIVDAADLEKKRLSEEMSSRIKKLDAEIEAEVVKKLDSMRKSFDEEVNAEIASLDKVVADKIKELDKILETSGDGLACDVFAEIMKKQRS